MVSAAWTSVKLACLRTFATLFCGFPYFVSRLLGPLLFSLFLGTVCLWSWVLGCLLSLRFTPHFHRSELPGLLRSYRFLTLIHPPQILIQSRCNSNANMIGLSAEVNRALNLVRLCCIPPSLFEWQSKLIVLTHFSVHVISHGLLFRTHFRGVGGCEGKFDDLVGETQDLRFS